MDAKLRKLMLAMIEYNCGDARRIQHLLKVHTLAKLIGEEEKLDDKTLYILEAAALTHDIGIRNSERNMAAATANSRKWKARRKRKNCCAALILTVRLLSVYAG